MHVRLAIEVDEFFLSLIWKNEDGLLDIRYLLKNVLKWWHQTGRAGVLWKCANVKVKTAVKSPSLLVVIVQQLSGFWSQSPLVCNSLSHVSKCDNIRRWYSVMLILNNCNNELWIYWSPHYIPLNGVYCCSVGNKSLISLDSKQFVTTSFELLHSREHAAGTDK